MSINLFIPAAGYGTRLQPLTDDCPKPFLPVAGIPLIQRIIESIQSQIDVERIGINTHYLPEIAREWAAASSVKDKITLFHEADILGTGGALVSAAELFREGTCLLVNGDVINGMDWRPLLKFHRENGSLVTLAVQDRSHERRVGVDSDMNLVCIDKTCSTPGIDHWFGYACAAVYEPDFLDYLPSGKSHVVPFWVEAAQQTGRVKAFDIGSESYWLDIGTPLSYAQAVVDNLSGEQRFFAEPLQVPFDCELTEFVAIERKVKVGADVSLQNVILLPEATVTNGSALSNCIVAKNGIVNINWPGISPKVRAVSKIGHGGSDRIYSREHGHVKLKYSAFEPHIVRQIDLTKKLTANGVRVPRVLSHDSCRRELKLEDLGDITFRAWLPGKSIAQTDQLLEEILDQLFKMHFSPFTISDKVFDYAVLRWETSYFLERFVRRICGIHENFSHLQEEFHRLALEVDSLPKLVMHRDFQSENIMVKNDRPWLIDFQAAHQGPPFFDLVALLADPYIQLDESLVLQHKSFYLNLLGDRLQMTPEQCDIAYTLCGLQRHMQALGAYGFLATIRGKKSFLQHIPAALRHLSHGVQKVAGDLPQLDRLTSRIKSQF